MTQIHYFPRYAQRENFITNNTLLLLKRLHDWNRLRFQRFLETIVSEAVEGPPVELGLQITQQRGTGSSVVDGHLDQHAFRIAIETKAGSKFEDDQLQRHVKGFPSGGYLLLLSPDPNASAPLPSSKLGKHAKSKGVYFLALTFERIIGAFRNCLQAHDEEMLELLNDFEAFCSEEDLLRSDERTIFAPPCRQSLEINVECQLYFCPSAWSRKNTRYIGFYSEKAVRHIAVVTKVAYCEFRGASILAQDFSGKPLALTEGERNRIKRAAERAQNENGWDIRANHKFFLCEQPVPTCFEKSTPGGIMGHRYLYLDDILKPVPRSIGEIADQLRHHTWK